MESESRRYKLTGEMGDGVPAWITPVVHSLTTSHYKCKLLISEYRTMRVSRHTNKIACDIIQEAWIDLSQMFRNGKQQSITLARNPHSSLWFSVPHSAAEMLAPNFRTRPMEFAQLWVVLVDLSWLPIILIFSTEECFGHYKIIWIRIFVVIGPTTAHKEVSRTWFDRHTFALDEAVFLFVCQ